jgi:UDP-N-acetyl-D-galactosamine dehydrogenase
MKDIKIAVIGLGYVGLPLALEFAKKNTVIGFDIKEDRVDMMKNHIDPSKELGSTDFENCDITFTSKLEDLRSANFYIIAVPTPIDDSNLPNLKPILSASETVAKVLKKGDYVVYESTVYPGCTEDDCIPVLEEISGLKFKEDFKVGYSPERINPGDKVNTLTTILKIVSACGDDSLEVVAKVYESIIKPGVHRASTIKVAEAAKIIENTQRDLNIALMNELSIIFSRMDINTFDVIEAAGTKWNFLKFQPGLVGGHCIGVDPYYLTHKAAKLGYHAQVITAGRFVNDSMGAYVAKTTVKKIIANSVPLKDAKVLIMGATFKEDVADVRNSKVSDVVKELRSFSIEPDVIDPNASSEELMEEYGFGLVELNGTAYDAVIVAVNHKEYTCLNEADFMKMMPNGGSLMDVKGVFKDKITDLEYWSL